MLWNESTPPASSWMPHLAPAFSCMALAIALKSSCVVGNVVYPAFSARSLR